MRINYLLIIAFFILFQGAVGAREPLFNNLILQKAGNADSLKFSGDNQYQVVNKKIEHPIKVRVTDNSSIPKGNIPVQFNIVYYPNGATGATVQDNLVRTDRHGVAETFVTLGSEEGEYRVIASIKNGNPAQIKTFTLFARKSNWVTMILIGLVGGLGLFLFGIEMMVKGMQKSAGDKMRSILSSLTHNRFVAVGVGTFVTMIIQSSSATTVMLVGFVHSKLIKFKQSIGVILGAAIGTTITVQLIAFKLTDYSLLLIGIGFVLQIVFKSRKYKNVGETILGFGLLFFGMHIMSQSMFPLRSYHPFIDTLLTLEYPVLGILAGAVFTAIIQSSSAFIGIMIILGTQGLLSLEASIPLILGANLGTSITVILASINTTREARKVAIAHSSIKMFGIIMLVWWIPDFAELIKKISPSVASGVTGVNAVAIALPRQIANAHTIFNVFLALLVLPLVNYMADFINRIYPEKEVEEDEVMETKFLDPNLLNTPALALSVAKEEVIYMGRIVQNMVNDIIIPFLVKEPNLLESIETMEKKVNYLRDQINTFLLQVSRENIQEERVKEAFQMMYTVKEFEQIADIVSTTLLEKARHWVNNNYEFSDEGKKEIVNYHSLTQKQISRAIEVFRDVNLEKALQMKLKYKKYRNIAIELEKQHFERLKEEVGKSLSSSKTHLEIMGMLRLINSHATNVARILLQWEDKKNYKNLTKETDG